MSVTYLVVSEDDYCYNYDNQIDLSDTLIVPRGIKYTNWYSSKTYCVPDTAVIILFLLFNSYTNCFNEGFNFSNLEVRKIEVYSDKIILLKVQLVRDETRIQTNILFISLQETGHLQTIHQPFT